MLGTYGDVSKQFSNIRIDKNRVISGRRGSGEGHDAFLWGDQVERIGVGPRRGSSSGFGPLGGERRLGFSLGLAFGNRLDFGRGHG